MTAPTIPMLAYFPFVRDASLRGRSALTLGAFAPPRNPHEGEVAPVSIKNETARI